MTYLFLASSSPDCCSAVRVMFFGAERRRLRSADALPLRRSEPAIIGFLLMFGVAGYLLTRQRDAVRRGGHRIAALLGLAWAALVTRLAVATARMQPEHDPEDPRYVLQGHVAIVSAAIPAMARARSRFSEARRSANRPCAHDRRQRDRRGRGGLHRAARRGDVAFVELWAIVEQRL